MDAVQATTPSASVTFIADWHDKEEIGAIHADGRGDLWIYDGNYAQKIQSGIEITTEPLIFTAADDLVPRRGWFERAKSHLHSGVQVVGTNDLINRKRDHQTHFLMTREYAERPTIDGGPGPFHHGYFHWFCDDEFLATAKHRGVYAYAQDAIVRHLHPMVSTAPDDDTYRKGRENQRFDRQLFRRRARLWT